MGGFVEKVSFPAPEEMPFDELIDVRSPLEFAEDQISGAINLPVLDDDERADIGTIYRQVSAFEARRKGAAIVSRNIANHIDRHFASKPKGYRCLVYCWRGGQRSESMATILSGIGWHVCQLEGGYSEYRRHVVETIREKSNRLQLVVLNGLTGAGKTRILETLQEKGEQILDLEGYASHRGSVFGGDPQSPQPAQKRFESLIFDAVDSVDLSLPVYIEAESAKIGRLNVPNPLWQKMKSSPVIEINSPLESRADHLLEEYREWLGDLPRIEKTIERLKGFHSDERLAQWKELAQQSRWKQLIEALLDEHYDRRYRPNRESTHFERPFERADLIEHDADSLEACAETIVKMTRNHVDLP